MIEKHLRSFLQTYFDALGRKLAYLSVTPNQVTLSAFIFGIASALFLSLNYTFAALSFLWLSGLCDVLDGTLARLTNKAHPFGAYTDLISDRMVESALILGFALQYPQHYLAYILFLIVLLFHFSTFVVASSVFQNCGPKSIHYDRSIVERAEAFIVFSAMLLFPRAISLILTPFNVIIFLSACARFLRVKKACQKSINKETA